MNGAGSKAKGSDFERSVCKRLSFWMTRGFRDDLFWRSAMSGGRATVQFSKGARNHTQVGDISAIDPWGEKLTSQFLIECKSYKDLKLLSLLQPCDATAPKDSINAFWLRCCADAAQAGRLPMMVVKQNRLGEFVLLELAGRLKLGLPPGTHFVHAGVLLYHFDTFLLLARRP